MSEDSVSRGLQEFGIIGLGRMGRNLSLQALDEGWRVVGFDKFPASQQLVRQGLVEVDGFAGFREDPALR